MTLGLRTQLLTITPAQKEADAQRGVPILSPFLTCDEWRPATYGDPEWRSYGGSVLKLTDTPDESNFFLFPYNYNRKLRDRKRQLELWLAHATRMDRKLVVFAFGDDGCECDNPRLIAFDTSLYGREVSACRATNIAAPTLANDIWKTELKCVHHARKWNESPRIGFCGMVELRGLKKNVKRLRDSLQLRLLGKLPSIYLPGKHIRSDFLRVLKQQAPRSGYECTFIERHAWLSTASLDGGHPEERQEYLNNMIDSDYTVCVKGGGNYSIRFYECAAVGRIPILVDTDCVLPFESQIDYRSLMPIVPANDLGAGPEIVMDFHEQHRHNFEDLQREWLRLAKEVFSPLGFHRTVTAYLRDLLNQDG